MCDAEPLNISLVAHHVFCPRRAWLEAAGEKVDSYQIAAGTVSHEGVDNPATSRDGRYRSIDIAHRSWNVVGRADALEVQDGSIEVIEYKAAPVRKRPEPTAAMRIQLALQTACLQDMGHRVGGQSVFFTTHHRRIPVVLREDDFREALEQVSQTRSTVSSPTAPEPLLDDPRCMGCSHAGICLPEERAEGRPVKRVHASDPDSQIVHLVTSGSRAYLRGGRLRVSTRGEEVGSYPMERVAGLVLHGNIDLSAAVIRELMWLGRPVVWCSGKGRVIGWGQTASAPNGLQRVRQHQASAEGRLDFAREFVSAKIANQATLLRRNGSAPDIVRRLRASQRAAQQTLSLNELYGVEGEAAARYFSSFSTMLRGDQHGAFLMAWPGRSGRGAVDMLNVALNFAYGLLVAETIRALTACGLDPHAGFLHSSSRNKPALALDLMEEFRAAVGDAVVLTAINNKQLTERHFSSVLNSSRLRDSGRRALVSTFERRMNTEFAHPVFKYKVTWRRAIEVQARMLLGCLDGTQPKYVGVKTR